MVRDFNWSGLTSPQFEALVQTLVFYKDSKAYLFNRPGPDGAQDALSGDGQTVYQAKYHPTNTQSSSHAFSDATSECRKIKQYKSENDSRWDSVNRWILVSPVTFGSQDFERWNNEIVPLFREIGLQAEIWHSSILESEMIQRPELIEVYFEGANRCFLSLPEFRSNLFNDRLGEFGLKINCIGRNHELNLIKNFLDDPEKKLLAVVGESGIGKTRLLYEAGKKTLDWKSSNQVLWAQVSTMGTSEHWFKAINFQTHTLALIDGLESLDYEHAHRIFKTLREQILTPRSKWKAIIAIPSRDWLDSISNHSRYKTDAEPIVLNALSKEDAKRMSQELLSIQRPDIRGAMQEKIAEDIASHSYAIPLWIVAGSSILSEDGNLLKSIKDPYGIAKAYLKDSLKTFTEKEIEDALFWVAVYHPVQKADQNFLSFISRMSGALVPKIEALLIKAEDQRIVHSYGVSKRLIKIVPQGLADNIIYKRLLNNSDSPSGLAQITFSELLDSTDKVYEPQKLIHAFGKVGFHCDDFKKLLRQFSDKIISHIKKNKNVLDLKKYLDLSKPLAIYEPEKYLKVIKEFRIKKDVPNKEIRVKYLPPHTLTYKKEVQANLARAVYESAPFFYNDQDRKLVLDEMISLCRNEFDWFTDQERERRNNEDKGGLRKLSDILFMESPYLRGFEKVARERAIECLKVLKNGSHDAKEGKIIEAVIKPQLRTERQTTYWFDDKIVWEANFIQGYLEETRKLIVNYLRVILKQQAGLSSVQLCLSLFADSHHEANNASLGGRNLSSPSEQVKNECFNECRDNLNLICEILPKLSLEERELARKLWDWNLRFDKREELKTIASKCESLRNGDLDGLDLSVFSYNRWDENAPKDIDNKITKIAAKLARETDKKIYAYLSQALTLEASNHTGEHITELARLLGKNYYDKNGVQKYLSKSLSEKKLIGKKYGHFQIATAVVSSQCELIRRTSNSRSRNLSLLIESHLGIIPSNDNKSSFFYSLYADRRISFCKQDLSLILKYRPIFTKTKNYPRYFNLLGSVFLLEPGKIKKVVEDLWSSVSKDQRNNSYEGLLNGLGLKRDNELLISHRKWLFEQTVWIEDPDRLEHTFRFIDIFRDWKCSLEEFYQIILKRLKQSTLEKKSSDYKILPHDEFLNWVSRIDDQTPAKQAETILKKYLTLENKDNWQIKYYLPQVLSRIDSNGFALPNIIFKKVQAAKSLKAKKEWLRYAAHYSEKSTQWRTIVLPVIESAQTMDRDTQVAIYSIINSDLSRPTSWSGSAVDHWQAQVNHAEKELQGEQNEYIRAYLEWKVEGIRRQRDHFVEWEEED